MTRFDLPAELGLDDPAEVQAARDALLASLGAKNQLEPQRGALWADRVLTVVWLFVGVEAIRVQARTALAKAVTSLSAAERLRQFLALLDELLRVADEIELSGIETFDADLNMSLGSAYLKASEALDQHAGSGNRNSRERELIEALMALYRVATGEEPTRGGATIDFLFAAVNIYTKSIKRRREQLGLPDISTTFGSKPEEDEPNDKEGTWGRSLSGYVRRISEHPTPNPWWRRMVDLPLY